MAKKSTKVKQNKEELQTLEGVEVVEDTTTDPTPSNEQQQGLSFEEGIAPYLAFLEAMRVVKKSVDVAPDFTPKNFYDQIQLYDNAGTRRLYLYVNGDWRYVALT